MPTELGGQGRKMAGSTCTDEPGTRRNEGPVPIASCVTLGEFSPFLRLSSHIWKMESHLSPDLGPGAHRTGFVNPARPSRPLCWPQPHRRPGWPFLHLPWLIWLHQPPPCVLGAGISGWVGCGVGGANRSTPAGTQGGRALPTLLPQRSVVQAATQTLEHSSAPKPGTPLEVMGCSVRGLESSSLALGCLLIESPAESHLVAQAPSANGP